MGRKSNNPPGSLGDIVATTEQFRAEYRIPVVLLAKQSGYDASDWYSLQAKMLTERQRACVEAFSDAMAELIVAHAGMPIPQWRYQQRYGYVPMFASKRYRRF